VTTAVPPLSAIAFRLPGHVIEGAGLLAIVVTVEELFARFGSNTVVVAETVLLIDVAFATEQLTLVTSDTVSDVLGAIEANEIDRLFPLPPHTPAPVALQDTNAVFAGRMSLTTTLVAVAGPAFETVIVYVRFVPVRTGSGESV